MAGRSGSRGRRALAESLTTLRTQAGTVIAANGRELGHGELAEATMALPVPGKLAPKHAMRVFIRLQNEQSRLFSITMTALMKPPRTLT